MSRYRLSDNYARFYLKYIQSNKTKINNFQFADAHLSHLKGWSSTLGLQFENLVLNNRRSLWKQLHIPPEAIINDNPYFQRKTQRNAGCQIDYMIQLADNILYICEIKFSKHRIGMSVAAEMKKKINHLSLPKHFSYQTVLIHVNGVNDELEDSDDFTHIIDFGSLCRVG